MRTAIAIASLWLVGCFYVEPINQRPSLDILQDDASAPIFRDQDVSFTARANDPDDHGIDLTWRVYMCTDATTFADCDADSYVSDEGRTFKFRVPNVRNDGRTPVEGMRIVLDGRDDHGAVAKPAQQLQLPVLDRSPHLQIDRKSVYAQGSPPQFVVNMPIILEALYWDDDDKNLDSLIIEWKVFAPMQVMPDFVDTAISSPADKRQVAKILRPQITGPWTVDVIVTDPARNATMKQFALGVIGDRAPCIATTSPIVPPPGTKLPVTEPTLFQVPNVSDDLDGYPKAPGGSEFGQATFVWSIGPAGGARQVISGATGSSVLFDPSAYTPGTELDLRVEIQDRKVTPVNCPDNQPACSSGADSCFQRQTWRVEAQ